MLIQKNILTALFFVFVFVINTKAENTVSGYVRTDTGNPIINCVVSDGFTVTKTNASGYYSLNMNPDSTQFVFISVPSAYKLPVDDNNLPLFYARIASTASNVTHDFTLKPFTQAEALADLNHVLIAMADPQVYNAYETYVFGKEVIQDVTDLAVSYPAGTHFYGVMLGDLVWDQYGLMSGHTANIKKLGFPVFNVIGNHDHDRTIRSDWGSDHYFKDNYGPTYYSVNRGKIHYVILDNINYTNVNGDKSYNYNIVEYQMKWLEQDIAETPSDMHIVFMIHAPFSSPTDIWNRVYSLVASRENTHSLAGHIHNLINNELKSNFYNHTIPGLQGIFGSYLEATGEPIGYTVFQTGDTGFTSWYYKSIGYDRNYQMRTYPVNSFVNGEALTNMVTAHVFNYDSKWGKVYIYENGIQKTMSKFVTIDPLARDFLLDAGDTRPNYGGSDVGQPDTHNAGATSCANMFFYKPQDPNADFEVEVTDRFGTTYREKVLKNLMVASFNQEADNEYYYRQDFNCYRTYPNQQVGIWGKCTYVQGHSPLGWYSCNSGSLPPTDPGVVWDYFNYIRLDNGSCADGALYAYGAMTVKTPANNDSDRAMGTLVSESAKNVQFGVLLENNTGKVLDGIELNYTGEMWRGGSNPTQKQTLKFSYTVNPDVISLRKRTLSIAEVPTTFIDSLSFASPASTNAAANTACDGNVVANQVMVSGKIAAKIYPGDVILLRWEDAGNDNGLAIDDLVIKAIPENNTAIDQTQINNQSFYNIGAIVYFDEAPMSDVSLYDAGGHLLVKINATTKTLDLSKFITQGIYFLQTKFGAKKIIVKT